MQGLFEAAGLPLQAKLSGSASRHEDIGERSTVGLVAGGKMKGNLIRLAGVLLGVIVGLAAMVSINGLWGFVVGAILFFGCSIVSDRIWRRQASLEEIRQDLENRARDTST
jgi:hypothetical protein